MAAMMEIDSKCIGGVPSVDGATRTVVDTSGGSQFSVDLLSQYYRRLFPAQELFRWLSYGNDPDRAAEDSSISADFFARREICFTLGKFQDLWRVVCTCFRFASLLLRELVHWSRRGLRPLPPFLPTPPPSSPYHHHSVGRCLGPPRIVACFPHFGQLLA